jgi:hypothetical protein
MKRILRRKKVVVVLACTAVGAAALAATAFSGILKQTVVTDGQNIHYRVVRTVVDGFDSGSHIHPGLAVVQVQEGSLKIAQGSCTPKTVGPGETFIEVPYLPVRGLATGRVTWSTTFLVRYEEQPTIPVPSPCT